MARPEQEIINNREEFIKLMAECAEKPSKFSEVFLKHKLFSYNQEYANCMEQFIIYRSGRQVGKTMTTAVKAIHYAFFAPIMMFDKNKSEATIVIAAPTQNQATIMFGRIRQTISNSDFLSRYITRSTQTEITVRWLNGKGTTNIITRAAGETGISLRGYSPDVIIVDECSFIKESIMRSFLPSGLATHAAVWLTSTPYSKNGYFYKACMNSRPKKKDGSWIEFHVKSTDSPLVKSNPAFLAMVEEATEDEYVQEVEGEFLDLGNSLIPRSLLLDAVTDKTHRGNVSYYMGVDVARTGRDETVYIIAAVDEENGVVWVEETKSESQSNMMGVAEEMMYFYKKYNLETIYIDETGLGGGLVDIARSKDLPVRGVVFTLNEKNDMYSNVRFLFENKRVKLKAMDDLFHQLSFMKREFTEGGKLKIVTEGAHDDYADAFALLCNAVKRGDSWHLVDMKKTTQEALFG